MSEKAEKLEKVLDFVGEVLAFLTLISREEYERIPKHEIEVLEERRK